MMGTRSLGWLTAGIVACFVIAGVVLLIASGTLTASGELWDVDSASDLEVGTQQQQLITNIEVLDANEPVKIHVGELVEAGARLDHNTTSYWIDAEKNSVYSDVYIENANSQNATIVVSDSAISSPGRFDLHIDNIDTTNVTRYNQSGSKANRNISYTAEQGRIRSVVEFSVSFRDSIEINPKRYNESTQSIFYNYSHNKLDSNYSITIWENRTSGGIGRKIKTIEEPSGNLSLRSTDIEGKTELIIGLHSPSNKHGLDAIYELDRVDLNITVPPDLVEGPFYYKKSEGENRNYSTLLFEFNTNLSNSQGKIRTNFSTKETTTVRLGTHSESYYIDGNLLYVYPNLEQGSQNNNIQPEINGISIENIRSTTSNTLYENRNITVRRVDQIISENREYLINNGSNIGFNLKNRGEYIFSKPSGEPIKHINASNSPHIHKLNTDSLSTGNYSLNSSSRNSNATVKILNSTFSVESTDTVSGSQIPISISASGTKRTAVLSLSKPNKTEVYLEEFLLDNTSNISRSIPVSQSGIYTVGVRDLNTGLSTTQDVNVAKSRTAGVRTGSQGNPHSGGHLNLSLNSTYNRSSVHVTGPNNTTTTLKLKTTNRGPTPVRLNTYATPRSPSEFVSTGPGVSVESVAGDTGPLSPGTYDLTLRSEHGTAVTNDTATVTVGPRSTDDLSVYTTRRVAPGGFENATGVRDAIADGTLAPATSATANDTVVYAVNATGLTGLPASANVSLDRGADLARLDGLSFGVAPTNASSADVDAAAAGLGRAPNESAVHLDRRGLFLVADGDRAFGTEDPPATGRSFEATFRVDDDRLRRTARGDDHRVTAPLRYASAAPGDDADGNETREDPTGTPPVSGGPNDPEAPGSSGGSGGSGASDGSGGSGGPTGGGSTAGGGPVEESGGPGDAAGAPGSIADDNGTEPGVPFGNAGSPGLDANGSATGPGSEISIALGASGLPPTVGPPELFGTDRFDRGADEPPSVGSRPTGEGSADAGDRERDDPTGATSADSADPAESTDAPAGNDPSPDEAAARDLGYDEAPIRSTVYDLPGFGPVASLAALAAASLVARCRGRGS